MENLLCSCSYLEVFVVLEIYSLFYLLEYELLICILVYFFFFLSSSDWRERI